MVLFLIVLLVDPAGLAAPSQAPDDGAGFVQPST
jgi:hypothetical protein